MAGEIQVNSVTALTESGSNIVLNNVNTVTNRTALGLGTVATQAADNISITGGSIDNVSITGGSISSVSTKLVDANFIGSSSSDTSVSGYKIYAYQTGNGTASYAIKVPSVIDDVDILIVGAGGGTTSYSGGGGGGGVIHLDGITLTPNVYYITVGSGSANSAGGDSILTTYDGSVVSYTAKGGGNGADPAAAGGSGAGGRSADSTRTGGSSTQSSQSHSELPFGSITQYGNPGGSNNTGSPYATGGGGGAGASGQNAQSASVAGNGGNGVDLSTHFGTGFGASGVFAGGGGGMVRAGGTAGSGGTGGGGAGGVGTSTAGTAGTNYTGGGAGGNYESGGNLAGGHGIILIRVPI